MKSVCLTLFALSICFSAMAIVGPIMGTTMVCAGSTTPLSDTSAGGIWSSGTTAVAIIGSSSGIVTGVAAGTAAITYTTGSGFSTTIVTVNPLPQIDTITGGGHYCMGGSGVHIGLNGSSLGVSYILEYGSSATGFMAGTGAAIDFGPLTTPDTYTVSATYSATGCTAIMYGTVSVSITPTINASVSISAGIGDTVCAGTAITFTASTPDTSATPGYRWVVNGVGVSAGSSSYTYIPANGDSIHCVYTGGGACIVDTTATSNTLHLVVLTTPMIPVITLSAPPMAPITTIVTVNAAIAGAGSSYHINWYNNSILFSSTTVPSVTYTKGPATDHISATVLPDIGCRDSSSSAPVTILVASTGFGNISVHQIAIYPNPATATLTIRSPVRLGQVTVTNTVGQTVLSHNCSSNIESIDVTGLSPGIFFVKIDGSAPRKFVKW